jgi:two-component system, NtrC family, response regulator HydG
MAAKDRASKPIREEESLEDVIARRLLAQTPSLWPLSERLALVAQHNITVLLTGETGTGKTFLARLIHDCSPRQPHRFVTVPCGALAPNLVESELFGHVQGAFTGADRAKLGKFEAAGEGTLLLDEIDVLPLEQQAGLLRVIETGEYEAVGSNETRRSRARLIVASNWDLEEAARTGKFRQDLYYRLNVMSFHLPPLRERWQDIEPLVRGLLPAFANRFQKEVHTISADALGILQAFSWPGNIRQLENVVQQAVLVCTGPTIDVQHLPQPLRDAPPFDPEKRQQQSELLFREREQVERCTIVRALQSCGNSRARAANLLGVSRITLYKKMKKYGLMGTWEESDSPESLGRDDNALPL